MPSSPHVRWVDRISLYGRAVIRARRAFCVRGAARPTGKRENFDGPLATAGGLVFCAGTRDQRIRAFDAQTGGEFWARPLPFGGYAPPGTYEVNGRQFVVIPATGGGKLGGPMGDALVAFALRHDPAR
jgi:hypothetical protein